MKILIAGDFCPQHRVANQFEKGNFEAVLGDVRPVIEQADYAIVNFECPVCHGGEKPIEKCGPNLGCSERGVEAAKWAGFACVTLANNHFLDYGEQGVANTLAACKKYDLDIVGGGNNLEEAQRTLYKDIHGRTLAIVNCCEHEFSIATETTAGSNPLNPIQQYYAIKEARSKADYVLVIVHGGHEMWQLPSTRMQETYRFFIDAGADAVVNHHQHCFSGMETYKRKPIVYGLGNFCFDKGQYRGIWNEGYMVTCNFGTSVRLEFHSFVQCGEQSSVDLMKDEALSVFEKKLNELTAIIQHPDKLQKEQVQYYSRCKRWSAMAFQFVQNRYLRGLMIRRFLPVWVSEKMRRRLLGALFCESHRDKIEFFLRYQQK